MPAVHTGRPAAEGLVHQRTDPFLDRLAERVRTLRNRRGMARQALAREAQVSERYLAQIETGRGNISILLLRRLARALGVPLADLVDERAGPPPAALRRRRVALIGLRGGGKSTLGRLLAERRAAPFIELDREVETMSGMRLAEMFELFGPERFRRGERAALEAVLAREAGFVLATGGGLVTERATFDLLRAACVTVWVRADPEAHMRRVVAQGDLRPMADSAHAMDDLKAILSSREPLYAQADVTLDTGGRTPEESAAELAQRLAEVENDGTPAG